jgi:penicillin amidase
MSDAAWRAAAGGLLRFWLVRIVTAVAALLAVLLIVGGGYVGYVVLATRTGVAAVEGAQAGVPVQAPVTIARDARGVPHVRAASLHDLMVAEGYAMASDRLFQMDVTRRYVYGRLAEVLGSPVARVDRRMRRYAIHDVASRVLANAAPEEKAMLAAFADGVNAAARQQPTPPEYRALFFGFEPWRPEDALAVGFATVLDLDDKPDDVVIRDRVRRALGPAGTDAFYPLTDPRYDVPTDGSAPGNIAKLPDLPPPPPNVTLSLSKGASTSRASGDALILRQAQDDKHADTLAAEHADVTDERAPVGSNAWALGGAWTTTGQAVLANDPHLDIAIPGIWWLFEGSAPGIHIAGAALAGTPGVTLGHNEHVAWGVTAGETAAMRVYREPALGDRLYENRRWVHATHVHEAIGVRFGSTIDADVLRTPRGVVIARSGDGRDAYLMDWPMQHTNASPLAPFLRMLRARTAAEGVAAMRDLPEPALNVVVADDDGNAGYHFAGRVPLDPSFGRWATAPDGAGADATATLAYDAAPRVDPSRDAAIVTSNNRPRGGGPRLAPYWPAPYRANELHRALSIAADGRTARTHVRWYPEAFAQQGDDTSPAELEFARLAYDVASRHGDAGGAGLAPLLTTLKGFDGKIVPESAGATVVVALRRDMVAEIARLHLPEPLAAVEPESGAGFEVVLRMLRERPHGWVPHDDYGAFVLASLNRVHQRLGDAVPAFGEWAKQPLKHPLAPFGFRAWNGPTMPGRGGSFAPAVQWNDHAQSFRAFWIAGDWDRGTIDVDAGESGEPGSPHYTDQNAGWVRFTRTALPFSDAAVRRATVSTLTLTR